jgi:hypothetical protein
LNGFPFTVIFIKPTGAVGRLAVPVVADVALEKFSRFKKNCCHALVGLFVTVSKNSVCG